MHRSANPPGTSQLDAGKLELRWPTAKLERTLSRVAGKIRSRWNMNKRYPSSLKKVRTIKALSTAAFGLAFRHLATALDRGHEGFRRALSELVVRPAALMAANTTT